MKKVLLICAAMVLPCAVVFAGIPTIPVSGHSDHTDLTASQRQASQCDSRVLMSADSCRGDDTHAGRFVSQTAVCAVCVPEPSTLFLCSSGLVFLFGLARKR